ncbi:hypothetical protein ACFW3D_31760 [Streptomyces sp. NPDC058864]
MRMYDLKGSRDLDSVEPICSRHVSRDDEDLEAVLHGLRSGITECRRRTEFIRSLPISEGGDGGPRTGSGKGLMFYPDPKPVPSSTPAFTCTVSGFGPVAPPRGPTSTSGLRRDLGH